MPVCQYLENLQGNIDSFRILLQNVFFPRYCFALEYEKYVMKLNASNVFKSLCSKKFRRFRIFYQ